MATTATPSTPKFELRDTVEECITAKHWILHLDCGEFICYDCTCKHNTLVPEECIPGVRTVYVQIRVKPRGAWTNHRHELVWMGFDGMDNYYVCNLCGVQSHAHDYYASMTQQERDEASQKFRERKLSETLKDLSLTK